MSPPQEHFVQVDIDSSSSLLGRRRTVAAKNTIIYQLEVLKRTGRFDAFKLKWHPMYSQIPTTWPIPDHMFWDSDVAKWIEGACYFLDTHDLDDPVIEQSIEELVIMIRKAQHPDGYLNIHYSVVEPGMRFTNFRDMHELYNAGHLIEAALAHHQHFDNWQLLEPICKYVDLLCNVLGPRDGQIHGYPGHPEIELALLRLFHRTKRSRYLELAAYFLTERGNATGSSGENFYTVEAARRGHHAFHRPDWWPESTSMWYCQAHKPIAEQDTVEGHAVRAMYLYTAASDLVQMQPSLYPELANAVAKLWNNMVGKKMYATGGVGAVKQWEGFGTDYFLPQSTDEGGCYAETCAAIGVMMWAERMLQSKLSNKYSDIIELALYNAVLTAMSANGKGFTYINQLGSSDENLSSREEWFTVCCCPPNILRLLGHVGGYMFTQSGDAAGAVINIHLYAQSTLHFQVDGQEGRLTQQTTWPDEGTVRFFLELKPRSRVTLRLRVPAWAPGFELSPPLDDPQVVDGYLGIPGPYLEQAPNFSICFPLKPRLVYSHPMASHRVVSIARGPVVYCAEDVDNTWVEDHFKNVHINSDCNIEERTIETVEDGKLVTLVVKGAFMQDIDQDNYSPASLGLGFKGLASERTAIAELVLVPYHYRSNREGRGQMRAGFRPGELAL